jgi:hypothetical protein
MSNGHTHGMDMRARWRGSVVRAIAAGFLSAGLIWAGLIGAGFLSALTPASAQAPRFRADDPLAAERDTQDASRVAPWEIDLTFDLAYNLFGKPGDSTPHVRAQNVNTLDEVPDSSWFTNRAGARPLTTAEVERGPDTTNGPAAGQWTVTAAKSDGISPGFTIRDAQGQTWFLKFDPPGYRGMATGAEVIATKLFWALGYFVPENHVASLERERLVIGDGARYTPPGRTRRPMRLSDIDALLKRAMREPDGHYRVVASRALDGKPLGGFRFHDTRPDDPNDVVPHEHRRELRGYGVFSAWLNHVDAKAINSLDTLVTANGRAHVRHNLLDFGSTLGSGAVWPREPWEGYEYMVEPKRIGKGLPSFGFPVETWRKIPFFESRAVGRMPLDNTTWDPERWRPRVPNPAFVRALPEDKFWAARKLAAIGDDLIRAAVATGQLGDADSEAFLVRALIERRDAILRTYLPAVNPIVDPALDTAGVLTFGNAAVAAGVAKAPAGYRAEWGRFDNATGQASTLGAATGSDARLAAPAPLPTEAGAIVEIKVSATGAPNPSWEKPVTLHFRRAADGWQLVGLQRQ